MEIIKLNGNTMGECAARAAGILRAGGVVLYPTDTLYGLGANALSDEAVAKVKLIKGRDEGKPIHAIVSDLDMAARYGEVGEDARMLAQEFGGKVTLIVKKRKDFDTGIMRGIPTFGFRVPDNQFCIALARALGTPVTATSANKSGEKPERSPEKILTQLGHSNILENIGMLDLVIDAGELPERAPSTVVDLSGAELELVVLREGAISAASLHLPRAKGTTMQ